MFVEMCIFSLTRTQQASYCSTTYPRTIFSLESRVGPHTWWPCSMIYALLNLFPPCKSTTHTVQLIVRHPVSSLSREPLGSRCHYLSVQSAPAAIGRLISAGGGSKPPNGPDGFGRSFSLSLSLSLSKDFWEESHTAGVHLKNPKSQVGPKIQCLRIQIREARSLGNSTSYLLHCTYTMANLVASPRSKYKLVEVCKYLDIEPSYIHVVYRIIIP